MESREWVSNRFRSLVISICETGDRGVWDLGGDFVIGIDDDDSGICVALLRKTGGIPAEVARFLIGWDEIDQWSTCCACGAPSEMLDPGGNPWCLHDADCSDHPFDAFGWVQIDAMP